MKIENLIILFSALLITTLLVVNYTTQMTEETTTLTLTYREYVDTAVDDAVSEVLDTFGDITYEDGTFWTEESMALAKSTLLNSLAGQFGYPIGMEQDEIDVRIPVIMYVDYDGFYCQYVDTTENEFGHSDFSQHLSQKFTWEEDLENEAHIKYTIENIIYVTMPDGTTYNGSYDKVYERLVEDGKEAGFDVLASESNFETHKTELTISKMENNLNYFVNLSDQTSDETGYFYNIHMDYTNDELQDIKNKEILANDENADTLNQTGTTMQIINNVGMAAFFQGPVTRNYTRTIDIYTMASRVFSTKTILPVTLDYDSGMLEYHDTRLCDKWIGRENQITYFYTQEDAAAHGAYPCEVCW